MELRQIARALGGEMLSRGRVICPGPGHSREDRSLCVWFDGDDFTTHSFANDDFKDCRRHVEAILGHQGYRYHVEQPPTQLRYDEDRIAKAQHLWGCRIKDTSMVERYLAARGYTGPLPSSIGFLPPGTYAHPAMIAKFGFGDDCHSVHLTFLNESGTDKADLPKRDQRRTLGKFTGWPIVLAGPNDLLGLAIAEGIENALSAHMATGLGAWAAGSARLLPYLADAIPGCIEAVTICADEDKNEAGKLAADELARSLIGRGFEVFIEGIDNYEIARRSE
jgi:Toprim domain